MKKFSVFFVAVSLCLFSCQKEEVVIDPGQKEEEQKPKPTQDETIANGYAGGYVKFSDGTPATGVSVSDGFSVTTTNENGFYKLKVSSDCWYIYFSYPENAVITKNQYGCPDFYKKYSAEEKRYDFVLQKGTVEQQFAVFAMADPQAHNARRDSQMSADTDRFKKETVPAINAQIAANNGIPCYGITLGDIVYSEGSRNSNGGMTIMRDNFKLVNMPVFQTMGNHDYTFYNPGAAITANEKSSSINLVAQRKFEDCFGPVNYSFNRGKVHFVCMKDIYYTSTSTWTWNSYNCGFTDEQYKWLKEDLANVPKTKMVVLCVHIPVVGNSSKQHVSDVTTLVKAFKNGTIFSGHTHYYRGQDNVNDTGMFEHIHSAVCGQWWWSNIEGDGCPNGYTVYKFWNNEIDNAYFIGVNDNMNTKDYQMRIYKGDLKYGGKYAFFQSPYKSNDLLINVFNGDSRWTVKVYENDVFTGLATYMKNSKKSFDSVSQGKTYDIPSGSNQDWWAIGYHIGVCKRGTSSTSYYTNMFHMWRYSVNNNSAKITVEAEDPYGNTYSSSSIITSGTEYPSYIKASLNI